MAPLSERIRRFRQRVERDASAPPDEAEDDDDDDGNGGGRRPSAAVRKVREGVERGQAAATEVVRRGETDLQRAQDRIERRVVPLEHEARETKREAKLLGKAITGPVSSRARKAADELQELRDEAEDLRGEVSGPLKQQRDELRQEVDTLKDQFGGLDTDLDDLGTDVEEPLYFEAIDDPDADGDLFETIDDPLDDVEEAVNVDVDTSVDVDLSDVEGGVEDR